MEILEDAHANLRKLITQEAVNKLNSEYYFESPVLHKFIIKQLEATNMNSVVLMMRDLGYNMKIECTFEKFENKY